MRMINAVLFDLDGTLLDTAIDLAYALNQIRKMHGLPNLLLENIRPIAGLGAQPLLKLAFNIEEHAQDYKNLLDTFLSLYQQHLADSTQLFPGMEMVLTQLEERNIPWGIVTNKPSRFTHDLLKLLNLFTRPACIISGDSLPTRKPAPEPILHACQLMRKNPTECIYVGDSVFDMMASRAAGTRSLAALYGYIPPSENPYNWEADGYVSTPAEIMNWIDR